MKKSIAFCVALLLLISCAIPAFAAGNGIETLKINPYGGEEASVDTVKWFASSGKYFLFLPADTVLAAAKVYYTASDVVSIDNVPISSGGSAAAFTPGAHTLLCGGQSYALTVMQSASLPSIFIETASGSLDYLLQNKGLPITRTTPISRPLRHSHSAGRWAFPIPANAAMRICISTANITGISRFVKALRLETTGWKSPIWIS